MHLGRYGLFINDTQSKLTMQQILRYLGILSSGLKFLKIFTLRLPDKLLMFQKIIFFITMFKGCNFSVCFSALVC